MADFSIVPFDAEHLSAVMELERNLFGVTAWTLSMMEAELSFVGSSRLYWVALVDDQVVGYCGLYYLPPESDVQTIAVATDYQHQGIGSALFETMLQVARVQGCDHMMLEVSPDNPAAIAMYRKYGFEVIDERANYYGPGLSCFVMRCDDLAAVTHD